MRTSLNVLAALVLGGGAALADLPANGEAGAMRVALPGIAPLPAPAAAEAPAGEVLALRLARSDGAPREMAARLTRPARGGEAPAVILLPDGLGLDQRSAAMAERFAGEGWAVLEIDPDPVSTDGHSPADAGPLAMGADAGGLVGDLALVLELLGGDPGIDANRVAVVGLGTGGRAALLAGSEERMARELGAYGPRFAAHAALYPGCSALLAEGFAAPGSWSAAPAAVFHAGGTPGQSAPSCGALRDALALHGRVPALWQEYRTATYGWDLGTVVGGVPVRLANLGGGPVRVTADRGVAEDAMDRLLRFLRPALSPGR
ncbi:dienelactone hydrolase family protein [Muricoccus pecuniae]|uniref:Dienelactone hydrolase n=1 Tax=Muricoccus pecuniae TaxID=693023 RepID=A0A840YLN2_9PROT|nr:dienelactone hydrolase family protein [Roseomonas pecuniae]MBB5695304.1 dienelactone hydrolase [Roseomonas pecuniae]